MNETTDQLLGRIAAGATGWWAELTEAATAEYHTAQQLLDAARLRQLDDCDIVTAVEHYADLGRALDRLAAAASTGSGSATDLLILAAAPGAVRVAT